MSGMKIRWPADGGLAFARALLLTAFIVTPIATSLEIIVETVAYAFIVIMPEPRRRAIDALRDPLVIGALPLAAMIVIGTFHGPATWSAALYSLVA
jgi:hypothetical protein